MNLILMPITKQSLQELEGRVENELTILIVVISGEVRGRGRDYIEERIDVVHVPARGKDSCSIK